jgi:alcohol dehydrogenase (cytochrome c)
VSVADHRAGYGITGAPLAIEDSIVTGVAGGEYGIQGFIAAYDADTGQLRWKFNTIPGPGEPGHHTWEGDSWKNGGAATWMTGSFDPELDSLYWGVGNPSPTYDGAMREGDNLYANSVVALDPKTGRRKWHFQFTPHDEHDWDAVQVPILIESQQGLGAPRKLMLWANKNGFYYVLDRESGKMLLARALVRQNWAEAIDPNGRPILNPNMSPSPRGTLTYPGEMGATNWWPPAYSPLAHLFYVLTLDSGSLFFRNEEPFRKGEMFNRGTSQPAPGEAHRFAIQAVVPETGQLKWEYRLSPRQPKRSHYMGGLLSTAGGLIFGSDGAWFLALDAHTGKELWRFNAGGDIAAAPITYMVDGRQYVAVAAGRAILTFSLDRE